MQSFTACFIIWIVPLSHCGWHVPPLFCLSECLQPPSAQFAHPPLHSHKQEWEIWTFNEGTLSSLQIYSCLLSSHHLWYPLAECRWRLSCSLSHAPWASQTCRRCIFQTGLPGTREPRCCPRRRDPLPPSRSQWPRLWWCWRLISERENFIYRRVRNAQLGG